jgi:hypothetical protein
MPHYAAFIGHQPHISLAELSAAVPGFLLEDILDGTVVRFESLEPLDAAFLDTLGGTVVLAQKTDAKSLSDIPKLIAEKVGGIKGKVTFSLRTTGVGRNEVKNLYRDSKDLLKKKGKPSRYVGNDHAPAPSIVLRQNGVFDGSGGCEVVVLKKEDDLWIGVTVGAQDVEAYAKRDMQKPVRDTTTGLLPPKLAQVMLNFGLWTTKKKAVPPAVKKDAKKKDAKEEDMTKTIYDPFCGTGVIPMECLIREFKVMASDKAEKAVTGTSKNLEWTRKQYEVKKSETPSLVWKQDATKPIDMKKNADLAKWKPDAIVTETSLGEALKKRPTVKEANSHRSENEKLQAEFLKAISTSYPGTPVVCTWPVWYPSTEPMYLEKIWKVADSLGFEPALPPFVEMTDRHSLLYRRPDQFVGREIVILKPKKK